SSSWVYATLAINAVFGFLYAGISWQAHLGGFVTGLGCAAVMARLRQGTARRWQVPALLAVVILLAGLAWLKYLAVPAQYW
ncbi:MAG TPA: rhomboid family intramembrane serine protease, partial [Candidatus Lustribacter sp.]|nr:rhomboid family intramembrane serine protease [Candidatus Lustribacter sp.]